MNRSGLLTLMQWLSPSFPVGSYAYSQGMEAAIARGLIPDAGATRAWIAAVLAEGSGFADTVLLCHAMAPDADLAALAELALALAPGRERHDETRDLGAAFTRIANSLTAANRPPLPYPVAVGAAAGGLGLETADVAPLFLASVAANLVQVAVRFIPLGQTEGQQVLADLHPLIERVAASALETGLDQIGNAALRADLASLWHETMDVRIYRT
jgi:urease accessory protein